MFKNRTLRSRVAEFPPAYDDSEEDESASEAESSDDDDSFHSGDEQAVEHV